MQYLVSVLPDLLRVPLWRWPKIVAQEVMSGRYYVSLADGRSHFRKHCSSTAGGFSHPNRSSLAAIITLATGGSSVSYCDQ